MAIPKEAILLRVFVGEENRYYRLSLYRAIVANAREQKMAGATAFSGIEGFGRSRYLCSEVNFDAGPRQPVVVEIIDGDAAISQFLPLLRKMSERGLMTMERVGVRSYPRQDRDKLNVRDFVPEEIGP